MATRLHPDAATIPDPAVAHPLTASVPRAPGRWYWRNLIASLDPVRDAEEIHRITAGFEFPWDYQRSLEFALFRTYCVPSVSALLAQTGEFRDRAQKRYDDTSILMAEIIEHGYDSPRGKESLRNINRQHGQYDISNDDMLYVLSTFIYEPLDWIDRFGWRRLHPNERFAAFYYYREVGIRMGIKDIPEDLAEFRRWRDEYEREHFVYADTNHEIGTYTLELFLSWYPAFARPLLRPALLALIDDDMIRAFGFEKQPEWLTKAAHRALAARSALVRRLPVRRRTVAAKDPHNRTYPGWPHGHRPADLGPCPMH